MPYRIAAGFENLTEVRQSLDAVADGLSRALTEGIIQDAQPLLATTKALTPYGPGPYVGADPDRDSAWRTSGTCSPSKSPAARSASSPRTRARSCTSSAAPSNPAVSPITFREQAMARRAAVQHLPEIERAVDARIARLI